MGRLRASLLVVVAIGALDSACGDSSGKGAATPSSGGGEWTAAPKDLRKMTAVVRVMPPARLKQSFENIAARSSSPVVSQFLKGHAQGSFGSGFIMVHRNDKGTRAFVVTNRHVVDHAEDAEIGFGDGTTFKNCEIVYSSEKHDLAVVALPASATTLFKGGFVPTKADPVDRASVIASGYPALGNTPSYQVTDGKISNAKFTMPGDHASLLIQHTAAIDPGSSGGPLTNEAGDLVGVNVALATGRNSVFLAVPATAVQETVRFAHALVTKRRESSFMSKDLDETCRQFANEVASDDGRPSSYVSNQLVADRGIESYAVVANNPTVGPSVQKMFEDDPMAAIRASVVFRMVVEWKVAGFVPRTCTLLPVDSSRLTDGRPVRVSFKGNGGELELRWTFEQGRWRVEGGDVFSGAPSSPPVRQPAEDPPPRPTKPPPAGRRRG